MSVAGSLQGILARNEPHASPQRVNARNAGRSRSIRTRQSLARTLKSVTSATSAARSSKPWLRADGLTFKELASQARDVTAYEQLLDPFHEKVAALSPSAKMSLVAVCGVRDGVTPVQNFRLGRAMGRTSACRSYAPQIPSKHRRKMTKPRARRSSDGHVIESTHNTKTPKSGACFGERCSRHTLKTLASRTQSDRWAPGGRLIEANSTRPVALLGPPRCKRSPGPLGGASESGRRIPSGCRRQRQRGRASRRQRSCTPDPRRRRARTRWKAPAPPRCHSLASHSGLA